MKKNVFIVVFVFLSALSVMAKTENTIAVLPFTGLSKREGNMLADMIGAELKELGDYQIAARTSAIDAALKEQDIQRQGFTDADTISDLGKGANAKFVVSGHVQKLGDTKIVSVSIIDVETFRQMGGDYIEYIGIKSVVDSMPILATTLIEKIERKSKKNLPILAVVPFDAGDETRVSERDVLAHILAIRLANSGKYAVVARTSAVNSVMEELEIQASGLTDANTAAKLGKAINADYVLSGSVTELAGSGYISVSIVDVETMIFHKVAYESYDEIGDGLKSLEDISYKLTGEKDLGGHLTKEGAKIKQEEKEYAAAEEKEDKKNAVMREKKNKGNEWGISLFTSYSPYKVIYQDLNENKYDALFVGLEFRYISFGGYLSPYLSVGIDTIGLVDDIIMLDCKFGLRTGYNFKIGISANISAYFVTDYLKTPHVIHTDFGIGGNIGLEYRINSSFGVGISAGGKYFFNNPKALEESETEREKIKQGVYLSSYEILFSLNFYI